MTRRKKLFYVCRKDIMGECGNWDWGGEVQSHDGFFEVGFIQTVPKLTVKFLIFRIWYDIHE